MSERWIAVLMACTAAASCAGDPPRPAPANTAQSAARCNADSNAPWLDPQDRACGADVDCSLFVSDACGFVPISARAVTSGRYASLGCPMSGPVAPTHMCVCSVPGLESRCFEGCCQKRFSGTPGPWLP